MFRWLLGTYLYHNAKQIGHVLGSGLLSRDLEVHVETIDNTIKGLATEQEGEGDTATLLLGMVLPWRGFLGSRMNLGKTHVPWQVIPIGAFRRAMVAMLVYSYKTGRVPISKLHSLAKESLEGTWYRPFGFKRSSPIPISSGLNRTIHDLVKANVLELSDESDPIVSVADHLACYAARMLVDRVDMAAGYWAVRGIGKENARLGIRIMVATASYTPMRSGGHNEGPGIAHGVPEVGVDVRHGLTGEDILEIAARLSMPFEQFEAKIVAANKKAASPAP